MYSVFSVCIYTPFPPPLLAGHTENVQHKQMRGERAQSAAVSADSCGGCVWVVHWAGLPRCLCLPLTAPGTVA